MLEYGKIDINEGMIMTLIKIYLLVKNVGYAVIGILLIKTLIIKNICVMIVMICL